MSEYSQSLDLKSGNVFFVTHLTLDIDTLYAAWKAHDRRYDGKAFIGVRTTGIYCRPICPARTPLKKNVAFYVTAAAAEEAGFRPCLRCRPETSPGTPAWMGTSATVARAMKLIFAQDPDIDSHSLASRLGIGERQLRRLFVEHLGAPPHKLIQTRKLDLARKLLDETALPISEIALASGFESIRRFNDVFRSRFGKAPSVIRVRSGSTGSDGALILRMPYRPPLDWGSLTDFFESHLIPGVETWDGQTYSRTFEIGKTAGYFSVSKTQESESHLELRLPPQSARNLLEILARVRRLFDLDADPLAIAEHLARDRKLKGILARHPGLRVVGAWDGFEIAVRTILGQQVSIAAGNTFAGRIARAHGRPVDFADHPELTRLFPSPAVLAQAELGELGIIRSRGQAIRLLAEQVAQGKILLHPSADAAQTRQSLRAIPGIGEWTAEYIALRVLGDPNVLLKTDLVIKRELTEARHDGRGWAPWSSYANFYLWKKALKK